MSIKNRPLPVVEWDKLPMLLTDAQLAAIINVSASTLRKWRCEGAIKDRTTMPPFVRIGGNVRYPLKDVLAWIDGLERRDTI